MSGSSGYVKVGTYALVLNKYSRNQTILVDVDATLVRNISSSKIRIERNPGRDTLIEGSIIGVKAIYK